MSKIITLEMAKSRPAIDQVELTRVNVMDDAAVGDQGVIVSYVMRAGGSQVDGGITRFGLGEDPLLATALDTFLDEVGQALIRKGV